MRLWHYRIIPYLPKSQLLAQWRELNSIFVNQPKHILINYVYDYDKKYLLNYTAIILMELYIRNIKYHLANAIIYFKDIKSDSSYVFKEHNQEYLEICYYNLLEKFMRGQKDMRKENIEEIKKIVLEGTNEE